MNIPDEKESGSNIERARAKALNAFNYLKDYNFDYIVGLDDAIIIKGRIEPNVKEYINKILYDNYLKENEEFAFIRAYVIINKEGNLYETSIRIPYKYKYNENAVVKENSYPLSYASCPIGYDKPVNMLTDEERLKYYLKYVKQPLIKLNIK